MIELKNLATFKRYLWAESSLLIIKGDIGPVLEGMREYNARFGIDNPDEAIFATVMSLLAATGLAAVSLAERESWGWTLTLPGSADGFFVGIEPEGMMCIRVKEADTGITSVVVQRQKPKLPAVQSHYEALDAEPAKVVQRYFEEVEQTDTRLAVSPGGEGLLLHGLPGCDFGAWAAMTEDDLKEFVAKLEAQGSLKRLDEVLLFYECRCNDGMVVKMIENLPGNKRNELFGDLDEIEVECPRCGRKYRIKRKEVKR
jgi:hypothetical protein